MEPLFIGISGVARSGKDTLARLLKSELESLGKECVIVNLAKPLKSELDDFCYSNFVISAFTDNTDDKKVIRDLLVGYGSAKRKLTQGRYFTEKADKELLNSKADVIIVSDVRYDEYEKDELYWISQEHNGLLIHVSRFIYDTIQEEDNGDWTGLNGRTFVKPANQHEEANDPKIADKANYKLCWPTFEKNSDSMCLEHVEKIVQWLIDTKRVSVNK
jgi:hypothetical protein